MRNQPETLHAYNIPRLNWWFLISGLIFLLTIVLMVWSDYSSGEIKWLGLRADRHWKEYQHQFYNLEEKRLAADAKAGELRNNEAGYATLTNELKKAEAEVATKKVEENRIKQELDNLRTTDSLITRKFTEQKAVRDQVRSAYEGALERNNDDLDADEVKDALVVAQLQNEFVDKIDLQKQQDDAKVTAAEAQLTDIVGQEEAIAKRIKRMTDNVGLLTKRLEQLSSPLVQGVVNAPIIEFAAGTIKVEQIVVENHRTDVNFALVPRVDRCIICHKGIDRKDPTPDELAWREKHKIPAIEWSKLPQPLTSHPKQDLFVGENSPHPSTTFGCTVCHWGWDRETEFSRSGHTPNGEEKRQYYFNDKTKLWTALGEEDDAPEGVKPVAMTQRDAWQKNYHWEEQEFLLQPMREGKFIQASCLKCHNDQTNIKGGEQLDHGRRLIEQLGCWSCHKMKQLETYTVHKVKDGEDFDGICKSYDVDSEDVRQLNSLAHQPVLKIDQELNIPIRTLRKPGPSLYKVASKTNKEWMRTWLANPVAFRPNTYMPRFWGLDNNKDTPERNNVEINAISEFLLTTSEKPDMPAPPVEGDADHGKTLVASVGCMACHVIDDNLMKLVPPAQLAKYMDPWQYRRFRSQGPQLQGIGTKSKVNWIYAWLKNPKSYHPKTKMPNLRLSDQEAADIAKYLSTLHNEATDKEMLVLPPIKPDALFAETIEYLEVTLPDAQAAEKINKLDDLIEMYFVDLDTMAYYQEPTKLAREEAQQIALQKKGEEEYDDAAKAQAAVLAEKLKTVKASMQAAKDIVAAMSQEQKQNVFLGSKLIGRYGCFACHNIHGFETAKPIGTELTEWGAKPVSKLDFGLVEIEPSREAWLHQKLHEPRSYDKDREGITRKPQELLKMPKFNLTDDQIEQVMTVITGMTDEKLMPNEQRQLSPAEFQIERGRWMVKENNCQGCHLIENNGWAIRGSGIPQGMEPPMLSGTPTQLQQGQRTKPDWLFHFLEGPQTGQMRPWLKIRMPTFGFNDGEANILVRYFALAGKTQYPYQSPKVIPTADELAMGKKIFETIQCYKCHIVEGKVNGKPLSEVPEENLTQLAPDLTLAHNRLQRDWILNHWVPNPLGQVPGTRMPGFDAETMQSIGKTMKMNEDPHKMTEAVVDYVLSLGAPPASAASNEVSSAHSVQTVK